MFWFMLALVVVERMEKTRTKRCDVNYRVQPQDLRHDGSLRFCRGGSWSSRFKHWRNSVATLTKRRTTRCSLASISLGRCKESSRIYWPSQLNCAAVRLRISSPRVPGATQSSGNWLDPWSNCLSGKGRSGEIAWMEQSGFLSDSSIRRWRRVHSKRRATPSKTIDRFNAFSSSFSRWKISIRASKSPKILFRQRIWIVVSSLPMNFVHCRKRTVTMLISFK